jgi:serine/threonine-protein kinase
MAQHERPLAEGGESSLDPLAEHVQQTLGNDIVLKRVLGEGRSARVYLADQPGLGRQVAVKALMPRYSSERKAVARFKREARAMAGCPHPSIVSVYNVGETRNGIPFFVMEHVEGESLADRLRRKGRLPLQEAARIAGALADALSYAHERGLVHRDLKPEDVLIDRYSGRILLTDFGLAKSVGKSSHTVTLTGLGEILGTPAYLSPEQAECGMVDARSDQYSLAVVTYEMLAGQLPFPGPTAQDFVRQHAKDTPPSLLQVAPELPLEVSRVIDRAMMKEPGARFASADAFGQALRSAASAALAPLRSMAVRARRGRRWRIWQGAAIYAGGAWGVLEALTWSIDKLSFPSAMLKPAAAVVVFGFPVVMVWLWALERSEQRRPLVMGG